MDYFDYLGEETGNSIEEILERSQENQQDRIESEIDRLETELDQREEIHESIVGELESKIEWYADRLELVYKRTGNQDRVKELKQRLRRFYRELREERREIWRDRENLEATRRELLAELEELEDGDLTDLL
jgi:trichohyalin